MNRISFSKYSGSGNDFIMVDNLDNRFQPTCYFIKALCDRKRGIGADGLIALEKGNLAPYKMRIYNADGYEAAMCGNGIRCLKRFLEELGIQDKEVLIETQNGLHKVSKNGLDIKAEMAKPTRLKLNLQLNNQLDVPMHVDFVDTGVPHAVKFVEDLQDLAIETEGPFIRHHPEFESQGANANFVQLKGNQVHVRTWERGVEGETLACGTGAVASALISALRYNLTSPLVVVPKSQEQLTVEFKIENNQIVEVAQTGPAQFIFQGNFIHGPQKCEDFSC